MKLAFTLQNSTFVGGGDYSIFKFAEYLAKKGHEITIFTTANNSYIKEISQKALIDFHFRGYIPTKIKGAGFLNRIWDRIYTFFIIKSFIKKNKDLDFII